MKSLLSLTYEHLKRLKNDDLCIDKGVSLSAKSLLYRFEVKIVFYDEDGGLFTGDYVTGKTVAALKKLPT